MVLATLACKARSMRYYREENDDLVRRFVRVTITDGNGKGAEMSQTKSKTIIEPGWKKIRLLFFAGFFFTLFLIGTPMFLTPAQAAGAVTTVETRETQVRLLPSGDLDVEDRFIYRVATAGKMMTQFFSMDDGAQIPYDTVSVSVEEADAIYPISEKDDAREGDQDVYRMNVGNTTVRSVTLYRMFQPEESIAFVFHYRVKGAVSRYVDGVHLRYRWICSENRRPQRSGTGRLLFDRKDNGAQNSSFDAAYFFRNGVPVALFNDRSTWSFPALSENDDGIMELFLPLEAAPKAPEAEDFATSHLAERAMRVRAQYEQKQTRYKDVENWKIGGFRCSAVQLLLVVASLLLASYREKKFVHSMKEIFDFRKFSPLLVQYLWDGVPAPRAFPATFYWQEKQEQRDAFVEAVFVKASLPETIEQKDGFGLRELLKEQPKKLVELLQAVQAQGDRWKSQRNCRPRRHLLRPVLFLSGGFLLFQTFFTIRFFSSVAVVPEAISIFCFVVLWRAWRAGEYCYRLIRKQASEAQRDLIQRNSSWSPCTQLLWGCVLGMGRKELASWMQEESFQTEACRRLFDFLDAQELEQEITHFVKIKT